MITQAGAKKALAVRKKKAEAATPIQLAPNFPHQNAFVNDKSRYIAACCSRRAGKSNGLALRLFLTMERHPRSQCLYLSLTQESAKQIMWPVLQEIDRQFKLGCTFTESTLTIKHPNGSSLKLMGADLKDFVKRLKGRKFPGVALDEGQDFSNHLRSLIDDVLTPSIADYADGWLAITGTPGPVPQGYFFEVTKLKKYGYSVHEWTLLNNPHMPRAEDFIQDLIQKREWTPDNPTLLREYRNQWVLDVQSLWVRYKEHLNHYQELPDIKPAKYNYILGVDIGFKDADAIAVLAWTELSPIVYLVEEVITAKQGITELSNQIEDLIKRYNPDKIVMDEGGLGKKVAEELRRQKGLPIEPADKARKQEHIEFLNDALRTQRFKAKGASRFAQDSYLIQIDWEASTPKKIVIKKNPHSDIIDAVLYGFVASPAFAYQKKLDKPAWGTKEWGEAQGSEMWDAACQFFENQADLQRKWNGFDDNS